MGMLIVPQTIFISLAAGAILVAIMAVAASLSLLPAVLSVLGDKIDWGHIPFIQRAHSEIDEQRIGGFWDRLAHLVMRYPIPSLAAGVALLAAAAIPYFSINTGFAGVSTLPDSLPAKQAFLILDREFSAGLISPAHVVIDGQAEAPEVQQGIDRLESILANDEAFGQVEYEVNPAGDLGLLSVPVTGDPNSAAERSVERLHDEYVPQAFDGVSARVLVGGFDGREPRRLRDVRAVHAYRLRFRAGPELHPFDDRLPLDRGADQGRYHEPAVRRRSLWPCGARLAGGRRCGPAWLSAGADR